jgi:hypothetical protein
MRNTHSGAEATVAIHDLEFVQRFGLDGVRNGPAVAVTFVGLEPFLNLSLPVRK